MPSSLKYASATPPLLASLLTFLDVFVPTTPASRQRIAMGRGSPASSLLPAVATAPALVKFCGVGYWMWFACPSSTQAQAVWAVLCGHRRREGFPARR